MTYIERHRKDKSLKGARSGGTRPARHSEVESQPMNGMIDKSINGLRYTTMNDYKSPKSKLKVGKKGNQ